MLLAAVAFMPLVGLALLSARSVADATRRADDASEVATLAVQLDEAIRVQALIDAESYWAHAYAAVGDLGIPVAVVEELSGVDIDAEYQAAIGRVDDAIATSEFPTTVDGALIEARAVVGPGMDNTVIEEAYDRAEQRAGETVAAGLREVSSLATGSPGAQELVDSVDVLTLSVRLREGLSEMTEAFFGVRFAVASSADVEAHELLTHEADYGAALAELKALVPAGSSLKTLWEDVDVAPSVVGFFERVDELTRALFAEGTAGEGFNASLGFGDVDAEAAAFIDSLEAVQRHVEFVEVAASEVVAAADAIRAEAAASKRATLTLATVLGAAALAAVAAASWWIIRPLRLMATVVEQLQAGDLADHVREAGPAEVKTAARALNEAVDHITVAERQAAALAAEDLDSPVLQLEPSGRLGASLRAAVAALTSSLAEREHFRQRLAYEAAHDGLTGLANRAATMRHLGQALARVGRSHDDLAVLFVDIDNFKSVNDVYGHAGGDHVLRVTARRIASAIRAGDHLGRIGGDEFVVIAEPMETRTTAMSLAQRILDAIAEPVSIARTDLLITASIGVAVPSVDMAPQEILADADLAVYQAKSQGRASVYFCDDDLKFQQQHRIGVEQALEVAIRGDELTLHYQPITDACTRDLVAVEALVRWPRRSGRLDPPGTFIPIAERSDLILAVDRWVLHKAAQQLQAWDNHPTLRDVAMSVNLSARHLAVPTLIDDVLEPLRTHGVDPGRLTIELTETALLGDPSRAATALTELRSHGVRIAIDDFGTGYSSLTHLRQLPIDILKIDRSFVASLDHHDDRLLVQLIVDIGHLLGASITAEGVETVEQSRQLIAIGSDHLQGFGIAIPMPADQLIAWANRTPQPTSNQTSKV